jgi:hypothetical protein
MNGQRGAYQENEGIQKDHMTDTGLHAVKKTEVDQKVRHGEE